MPNSALRNRAGRSAQPAHFDYRSDIDGLRGVAVLAVIWFHSGLPGLPGGFIGVDIFFVISGYLITSIIHRQARTGRFSFAYFYQRRFRRIAPALVTVTAATLAAGFILLLPYELIHLAGSAASSIAMSANLYFWRTTNYFFALDYQIVPLLHVWSLGVEEQFYLLFPLALVVAARLRKLKLVIGLLMICSFLLCVAALGEAPAATFYLLATRGWELMIGASLAVGLVTVPRRLRKPAALAGAALMIGGFVLLSESDPFPGWRALVPTIGAALAIGGGPRTAVARSLSLVPLVGLGLISYSLYLWHWPVLEFLRHWRADLSLPPSWALAGIVASVAAAYVSYRWIEQPARNPSTPFRHVLLPCLGAAAAIVLASGIAIAWKGLPQRLPARVGAIASARDAYAPLARVCSGRGFVYALEHCRIGPPGVPEVLLWGDSHAAAISEAVAKGFGRPGLVVSMGACPPVLDWPTAEDSRACRAASALALQLAVRNPDITTVVLSADWVALNKKAGPRLWQAQQRVVDRINAAGKEVVVIAGVPDPGADVPWASAIRERFGRAPLRIKCPNAQIPLRGVTLVDVSGAFCGKPPHILFTDDSHPSRYAGLTIIAPAIRDSLRARARLARRQCSNIRRCGPSLRV